MTTSTCKHETSRSVFTRWYDIYYGEWHTTTEWVTESAYVDLDLHRCMCSLCGNIQYYSERARRHYQQGTGELNQ